MGSFRPGAGSQHLHWHFNFTGCIAETALKSFDYEVYGEDLYKKKIEQFDAKDDNLTLVQQYIYLTKWVSKDLDDEALNNIRKVFELMKAQGYKAILRFAYNHAGLNTSGGESKQWILRHIEQLTPLLNEYISVRLLRCKLVLLVLGESGIRRRWQMIRMRRMQLSVHC